MTEHSPTAIPMPVRVPETPDKLEANAIGVAQDTIIGLASSAPAATIAVTLAALAATAAYGGGPVIVLCGIPMLVLANTYRRLNLWNANCGASFEWVGRAINPYLGFLTGWLMLAGCLTGTISVVVVLSPAVLDVFGASATSTWPNIAISTGVIVVMAVIAAIGIRITAHTQVGMAVIEYVVLIGFTAWALVEVLRHGAGTFPITRSWFSLTGIDGKGNVAQGLLIAVFMYTGWDATVYVNEEVTHRRVNPGRAAVFAVALLIILYAVPQVAMQGVASPARLQAHSSSALVFVAQVVGGGGWAKVMAFALALSVIAATGTSIVLTARIIYGMASYRSLPGRLANISSRFSTPVNASVLTGVLVIVLTWVYLLATSVQGAFTAVVNVSGLLFGVFYILTALATMAYYRRRIFGGVMDALTLGLLPLGAALFLGWVLVKSLQSAPASQNWSLLGVLVLGVLLMLVARFGLRSRFFGIPRESES